MDMEYLLLLQDFRNGSGACLMPFLSVLTTYVVGWYPICLLAVFYWCFQKRIGQLVFMNFGFSYMLNGIIKTTFCVYRPWMRDARIVPPSEIFGTATGYSFPSGHMAIVGSELFPIAVWQWKEYRHKLFASIIVFFVLLIGFSRNYLGVHTPQDVLAGLLVTAVLVPLCDKLLIYMEKNPKKLTSVLFVMLFAAVGAWLYVTFKRYPMDYTEGKLLVDPKKMVKDSYSGLGIFIGCMIGIYLEKKFVNFRIATKNRLTISLLGVAGLWLLTNYAKSVLAIFLPEALADPSVKFVLFSYILAGYPYIISRFFRKCCEN